MRMMSAVMMIVSTSVGVGILGLPIATAAGGFLPSLLIFALAWVFMTLAAIYILDAKMQVKGHASLASMIKLILGKPGHWFASVVIFLLLYALLSTYLMAAVAWIKLLLPKISAINEGLLAIVFALFFMLMMICKERRLYQVNNFFGAIVLIAFAGIIASSLVPTQRNFFEHMDFDALAPAFPLLLTTFGFSIVVPAIAEYLHYDRRLIQRSILWGSFISLSIYIMWEWVAFGHIPLTGTYGLRDLHLTGDNGTGVVVALASLSHHAYILFLGRLFAFLLVLTSFLGISLALLHFLGDLLHLSLHGRSRFLLSAGMYIFPVIVVTLFPRAFVQFLSFSGIFVAILLGLFPVWMIFQLKRKKLLHTQHVIYRGWVMFAVSVFFALVILQEVVNLIQ